MRPFEFRNEDGLNDEMIGKEYSYEPSPADETCNTDQDCSPTRLLWCDRGDCKATAREGGQCTRGTHAMCYCEGEGTPRCDTGTCRCT